MKRAIGVMGIVCSMAASVACGSDDEQPAGGGTGGSSGSAGSGTGGSGTGGSGTGGTGGSAAGTGGASGASGGTGGAAAGTGGSSAGTGGSSAGTSGTGGSSGAAGGTGASALVDQAVDTCLWTTACLNTEDSAGGAAPNTNVGSCIATFMDQHSNGRLREPWEDFADCVDAGPTTCDQFRKCLIDRQAICGPIVVAGEDPDWKEGMLCNDGTRVCTTACTYPTCTAGSATCTAGNASVEECENGMLHVYGCSYGSNFQGTCATLGPSSRCVASQIGTCTGADAAACEGNVSVLCSQGLELRIDCSQFGQTCTSGKCKDGTDCTYQGDTCAGNELQTCASGHRRTIDCAALGGTCGQVRGAGNACVLP